MSPSSDDGASAAPADRSAANKTMAAATNLYEKHRDHGLQHDDTHPGTANAHRLQELTRQQRGFSELEAALPDFSSLAGAASPLPSFAPSSLLSLGGRLLKQAAAQASNLPHVAGVLSYLGAGAAQSATPRPVTAKDSVWLLDNVAYHDPAAAPTAEAAYKAEYVVAVMSQHPTCAVVDAVRDVAAKLGASQDDAAALATIEERITPFLQDILPGRLVTALHGADWRLHFSPGGRNGLSSDVRALPLAEPGALVPTRAEVPRGANGILEMQTFFASKGAGWGVISDIDDTIKRTQTSDPIGILQTTFVDEPAPIAGMPPLYHWLQQSLGAGSPFFYLSASPYNLYPFLQGFRAQHYPHGALVLRDATLMSVSGLLSTLTLGTQAYKVDRMHKIHTWLPDKTFVCIGDSTQSDPEAYGEIYRSHPGWVGLILIRKVTDIAALGIEEKNEPARFEKAFEGVPRSAWHVFEDPEECYALVERAINDTATAAEMRTPKATTVDDDDIADSGDDEPPRRA